MIVIAHFHWEDLFIFGYVYIIYCFGLWLSSPFIIPSFLAYRSQNILRLPPFHMLNCINSTLSNISEQIFLGYYLRTLFRLYQFIRNFISFFFLLIWRLSKPAFNLLNLIIHIGQSAHHFVISLLLFRSYYIFLRWLFYRLWRARLSCWILFRHDKFCYNL